MLIKIPRGWEIPERDATPEPAYLNRRQLLAGLGLAGLGGSLVANAASVKENNAFATGDRPVTEEWAATGYNNFYEFDAENKENVKNVVGKFITSPWSVKVSGLVNKPQTFDLDKLMSSVESEQRVYRFRCVEAWAMTVPWDGFPMSALIKMVEPKPEAKYVKFWSVVRPDQMPGAKSGLFGGGYKFPYYEGLRMDEAMHPLAFFATGMYGKPIPKQNGAPIRAVLPWKYGYKGAKSIERIEFIAKEPPTFWNDLNSHEYGFYSNVNPNKPHPRWSQATEKVLPRMSRQPTLMYNGYEKWVASLYNGKEY